MTQHPTPDTFPCLTHPMLQPITRTSTIKTCPKYPYPIASGECLRLGRCSAALRSRSSSECKPASDTMAERGGSSNTMPPTQAGGEEGSCSLRTSPATASRSIPSEPSKLSYPAIQQWLNENSASLPLSALRDLSDTLLSLTRARSFSSVTTRRSKPE